MVNVCSFVHCKNRVLKNGKRFHRIPAEITRSDEKTKKLSQKRRKKWLAMLRREDIESCSQRLTMLGFAAIILYLVSKKMAYLFLYCIEQLMFKHISDPKNSFILKFNFHPGNNVTVDCKNMFFIN